MGLLFSCFRPARSALQAEISHPYPLLSRPQAALLAGAQRAESPRTPSHRTGQSHRQAHAHAHDNSLALGVRIRTTSQPASPFSAGTDTTERPLLRASSSRAAKQGQRPWSVHNPQTGTSADTPGSQSQGYSHSHSQAVGAGATGGAGSVGARFASPKLSMRSIRSGASASGSGSASALRTRKLRKKLVVEGDWDMLRPSDYEGVERVERFERVPGDEQVETPAQHNTAQARKRPSPLMGAEGFGTGVTGHDAAGTMGRKRQSRMEGSGETAVGSELALTKEVDEGVGGWTYANGEMDETGDWESKRTTGTTGLTLLAELYDYARYNPSRSDLSTWTITT